MKRKLYSTILKLIEDNDRHSIEIINDRRRNRAACGRKSNWTRNKITNKNKLWYFIVMIINISYLVYALALSRPALKILYFFMKCTLYLLSHIYQTVQDSIERKSMRLASGPLLADCMQTTNMHCFKQFGYQQINIFTNIHPSPLGIFNTRGCARARASTRAECSTSITIKLTTAKRSLYTSTNKRNVIGQWYKNNCTP